MSAAAAGSSRGRVSIGAVLSELRGEFEDLSHSKLRFLEDQGLITPQRTNSRYRLYSREDIDRVRLILTLQRDRFMPLKEIAKHLDAIDRGLEPPAGPTEVAVAVASARHEGPSPASLTPRPPTRMNAAEFMASAGIGTALVQALENFGLVRPVNGYYGADDLEIATVARDLAGYGIEPRHLRPFRTAADREVSLVEQVTLPLRHSRQEGSPARAEEMAREISATCLRLHTALVRAALTRGG